MCPYSARISCSHTVSCCLLKARTELLYQKLLQGEEEEISAAGGAGTYIKATFFNNAMLECYGNLERWKT